MREDLEAVAGIVNFIIPVDVVLAIGIVFALENVVESYVTSGTIAMEWVWIYLAGVVVLGVIRLVTADEEEMDELEDDLDELTD